MTMHHSVPEEAFDKHVVLFGMTGAGKTSVIKTAIVEPDLEAGRRVLIITPKDDWWGLRLSRTGKSPGFDIPIFGGRHADYPLQVKDAALLAETYGTMKGSAIFCTAMLSGQDRARWFAAFAEKLLSANRGWARVVIDEAHVFMPKQGAKGGGAVPLALHAGNELVSQGRSQGLRIALASQRSAKLHNDSSTQCSCLIAMLLMAPADREAVKLWIEDQADPQRGKEIIASLATQNPGQAWVWAPAAKFLENVQFKRPSTFDSSAAPDDDTDADHRLKPINLDALQGKLAAVEAEAKANDPRALKGEVVKLKKEVADLTAAAARAMPAKPDPGALTARQEKAIQRAAVTAKIEGYADAMKTIGGMMASVKQKIAPLAQQLAELQADVATIERWSTREQKRPTAMTPVTRDDVEKAVQQSASPHVAAGHRPGAGQVVAASAPRRTSSPAASGDGTLSGPQLTFLRSLAWWKARGHDRPTRVQVAAIAGWRVTSGHLKNVAGSLRTLGLIDYPSEGSIAMTPDGEAVAPAPDTSTTLEDSIRAILNGPQLLAFDNLPRGGDALSREQIAEACGWAVTSGHVKNVLGSMRSLEIIDYPTQGTVARADWLRAA